jgi:hypothetical protein
MNTVGETPKFSKVIEGLRLLEGNGRARGGNERPSSMNTMGETPNFPKLIERLRDLCYGCKHKVFHDGLYDGLRSHTFKIPMTAPVSQIYTIREIDGRLETLDESEYAPINPPSLLEAVSRNAQALRDKIESVVSKLFKNRLQLVENPASTREKRWRGCTSAGGIPATSEQHGLSLLSAQLSTFESVFRQVFLSQANTLEDGGGNYGLETV